MDHLSVGNTLDQTRDSLSRPPCQRKHQIPCREFDSVILQRNPRLTDVQVEKEREKSFPTWLRSRVESDHEEEESPDDEDEFEEDDEDDAELNISSASDDEYR
ncbi:hypothetical protein Taro_019471 [Colocasia esculenta]|uniref:Uncharacterized protein n=1 Tax=Colocasia esculenta TaxID=4460 RepID=A0A843UWE9_COLES|nr:hypothetical protein [Colocasia esculenta]